MHYPDKGRNRALEQRRLRGKARGAALGDVDGLEGAVLGGDDEGAVVAAAEGIADGVAGEAGVVGLSGTLGRRPLTDRSGTPADPADAVETALRVGIRNFMARTAAIRDNLVAEQVQFAEALDLYQRLTSLRETNPNALWHHRMSLYGPICATCGKPADPGSQLLCRM